MSEPKTCPCGNCRYYAEDEEEETGWHLYGWWRHSSLVNFCPVCGAHLLPNGEVEPWGEVVGEAWLLTHGDGETDLYRDEPAVFDGTEWWDGVEHPENLTIRPAVGEKFRVLLVRPAAEGSI